MVVNVVFIIFVIKVFDLIGNVEDLFESVIFVWEVVIFFCIFI